MKKIIIAISILVIAVTAFAAGPFYPGTPDKFVPIGTEVKQLFTNYSTVGGSGDIVNTKFLPDQATWELTVTGSPSAYNVSIEGSIRCIDGTFYPLSEVTQADTIKLRHIALKAIPCVRAKINSKTGGGAFNVYILMRGQ